MGPLPPDKYFSFFGVLKSAFEAQPDKKGELSKVRQIERGGGIHREDVSSHNWGVLCDWVGHCEEDMHERTCIIRGLRMGSHVRSYQ